MRTLALLLVSVFSIFSISAQKRVEKFIDAENVISFLFDAKNIFQLDIKTHDEKSLIVEADVEGEYQKDLLIVLKEVGETIEIGADFQPMFNQPNDKLSAHKVISIKMKVWLPKGFPVQVIGDYTNVFAVGHFETLGVTLNDGDVLVDSVVGEVYVKTISGSVTLQAVSGALTAESKNGKVAQLAIPKGTSIFDIQTVNGDIFVKNKSFN